ALAALQPAFMDLFWGYYRTPQADRDASFVDGAVARCAQHYLLLDRHLSERPYLAADRLTMGDIPAGATLYRYLTLDVGRPDMPHLLNWYDRLTEREAYRAHVMVPYEELRG